MKQLLDILNFLTHKICGVGIVDTFKKAAKSKEDAKKARNLAERKKLFQAVTLGQKILAQWSLSPSFFENIFRIWAMGNLLEQFRPQVELWQGQVKTFQSLILTARWSENSDEKNPMDINALSQAVQLYQQCQSLIDDPSVKEAINRCQTEIKRRHQFQGLLAKAKTEANNKFFKQALTTLKEAQQLFPITIVETGIQKCLSRVKQQEKYELTLNKVRETAVLGDFQSALSLLEPAQAKFSRFDGEQLLKELRRVIQGKNYFQKGLLAEKTGALSQAETCYQNALKILPELSETRIRLSLINLKQENWTQAISHLAMIPTEQAAYLRGFALAKQGNLQQADREWQSLSPAKIKNQRQVIQALIKRKKLLVLREIEQSVDEDKLTLAHTASLNYIKLYGADPIVKTNLEQHIKPSLETAIWTDKNWQKIAERMESQWLENPDITSLHNWAIACYYYAQVDSTQLGSWLRVGATALANLSRDPVLKNIPWLGTKTVDLKAVNSALQSLLQTSVYAVKESNPNQYLEWRDRTRRDTVALRLIEQCPNQALKLKNLVLLPECYEHYKFSLKTLDPPQLVNSSPLNAKLLVSLYTPLGLAVAAAIEGDLERAIKIKSSSFSNHPVEQFATSFLSYSEGCYYLQQNCWKKAMLALKTAQAELRANSQWFNEIDRLCGVQKQAIADLDEHLNFAQFWYELLNTPASRTYWVQYKAEQICKNLADKKINSNQALQQLQDLQKIEAQHPIILELIPKLEYIIEAEELDDLLKQNKFEDAVKRAKKSQNDEIKFRVAKLCVEIFVAGIEKHELSFEDLYNLTRWAYELLPNDQDVKELYQMGVEMNEINKLMKSDRFEDAVKRAKYCQFELIRRYLAEHFILILLKGAESGQFHPNLILQLGQFAYQLCPNEPAFQPIYSQLRLR